MQDIKLLSFDKGTKETYRLKFDLGNYQEFAIDEFCNISSSGDYGTYSYMYWSPSSIGCKSFKEFLIGLDRYYVLCKMAKEDSFDSDNTIRNCKYEIIENRRFGSWSKEESRMVWTWLEELELQHYRESDLNNVQHMMYDNFPIEDYDNLESSFMPNASYSRETIAFYEIAFKAFQSILREEVSND